MLQYPCPDHVDVWSQFELSDVQVNSRGQCDTANACRTEETRGQVEDWKYAIRYDYLYQRGAVVAQETHANGCARLAIALQRIARTIRVSPLGFFLSKNSPSLTFIVSPIPY